MQRSLLVLDDVDLLLATSTALLTFLRAQLRLPLDESRLATRAADQPSKLLVIGTCSARPSAEMVAIFDASLDVPLLRNQSDAREALQTALRYRATSSASESGKDEVQQVGQWEEQIQSLSFPVGVKRVMRMLDCDWME